MAPPPQQPNHDRRSMLRASVLDVFVQLGAFDRNNPITQWMFEDDEAISASNGLRDVNETLVGGRMVELGEDATERGRGPEMKAEEGSQTTSRLFGMFRSKSKSRAARKREPATPDSSQAEKVIAPRGKSRTRGLLPSKSKFVAGSSTPSSVPQSRGYDTELSRTQVTPERSIRRVFGGRKQRKNGEDLIENERKDEDHGLGNNLHEEGWTYVAPPTPGAAIDEQWPATSSRKRTKGNSDAGETANTVQEDTPPIPRTFSFAIPRTALALDRRFSSAKQKFTRRPPSLTLQMDENAGPAPAKGFSTSLPPSPFILVAPENDDYMAQLAAETPYVLFTPLEQQQHDLSVPSAPVYPISVSKTIRRSIILDNFDLGGDARHARQSGFGLRRSVSLQDIQNTPNSEYDANRPTLGRHRSTRGRDVPFPTRPVLPLPLSISVLGDARDVRMSLDARASVIRQRYRKG